MHRTATLHECVCVCERAFLHACERADINGLRRLTAGVYRRRQANMRGQHFILFTVNVSAYTCVSNVTAKVISAL